MLSNIPLDNIYETKEEEITGSLKKVLYSSNSSTLFLFQITGSSAADIGSSKVSEIKLFDYDNLLEYARPHDSVKIVIEKLESDKSNEYVNPFIKGITRLKSYKLVDLIEFHRPFSSEQIYGAISNLKGIGKKNLTLVTERVNLSELGRFIDDKEWERVEDLLIGSKIGLDNAGKILNMSKKMSKEKNNFLYLSVTNFLQKYNKCQMDTTKWKKCRKMIAKILTQGCTQNYLIKQFTESPYELIINETIKPSLVKFLILEMIAQYGPYGLEGHYSLQNRSRQLAGLATALNELVKETGDCYISEERHLSAGKKLLGTVEPRYLKLIPNATRYQIGAGDNRNTIVFPNSLDCCEKAITSYISNYSFKSRYPIKQEDILKIDPDLDPQQLLVVEQALEKGLGIITGPPGVGKTRVISAIYRCLASIGENLVISAPTGLACKNIAKGILSTRKSKGQDQEYHNGEINLDAPVSVFTVAKLLFGGQAAVEEDDASLNDNNSESDHNSENDNTAQRRTPDNESDDECLIKQLVQKTGGLIIDEVSMLDLPQFYRLIKILPENNYRLLLVGDPNQLPSIGPGKVLKDLIAGSATAEQGLFPVWKLETNYRQQAASQIISNALRIVKGQYNLEKAQDFKIGLTDSDQSTLQLSLGLLERIRINSKLNTEQLLDNLVILSPYSNKQFLATRNINKNYKAYFNPNPVVTWGMFSIGDRVMQTKNDYVHSIVNGDIGYIREMKFRNGNDKILDHLIVEYTGFSSSGETEGKVVKYTAQSAREQLTLAYAISIHKSQGNGYKYVLVLIPQHYNAQFFNRNMLYTAVTRAKECVYLMGGNYDRAIQTVARERYTRLASRIRNAGIAKYQ